MSMSDAKYLTDGRKVVVIGKINANEYIVQEIFITEKGDEIPSGENFTTKSIHDEPVESWHERRKKEIKKDINHYETRSSQARNDLETLRERTKQYAGVVKSAKMFAEMMSPEELGIFQSVVTGTIKWIYIGNYGIGELHNFDEWIVRDKRNYDDYHSGLRMISLFGKPGGVINYQTTSYNDGSGGNTMIYPFNEREDAIAFITGKAIERLEKDHFSLGDYEKCKGFGISLPKKLITKVRKRLIEAEKKSYKSTMEAQLKAVKSRAETLEKIESMV